MNGVSLAGRDDSPTLNACWLGCVAIFQGFQTSIAKKTIFFVIFRVKSAHGVQLLCLARLQLEYTRNNLKRA